MNHNNRPQGQGSNGDQSALSLLVNAADGRDIPRGQRDQNASVSRSLAESLGLRGLTGDGVPSLEEQLFLQQQAQGSFGGQGNFGFLSQLRDQNMLLSQLGQQQQLASLLGLGGGSSQSQDVRQALVAQMRQSQAAQQLTNADLLALTRSGALSGLSNIFGGGSFGGPVGHSVGYNGGQMVGYGGSAGQGGSYGVPSSQAIASELESLQRLEELERRQRLLATATETRVSSPVVGRVENVLPISAPVLNSEQTTEQQVAPRAENSHAGKFKSAQSPVVEAAQAPETTKEELEKAPGSVIVPCRARGMPMDHNFKTAFFVIPENVKHGEELICSYFACRNAGIKFRYCSHCKVPVAKRNFRKRHKHGGDIVARGADDDSVDDEVCVPVKRGIPSQITASREEHDEEDGISSQSADSTNLQALKTDAKAPQGAAIMHNSMVASEPKLEIHAVEANEHSVAHEKAPVLAIDSSKISEKRRQRWLALLAKRPSTKDGESMSGWLMEVLAVSDLETPLKVEDDVEDESTVKALHKQPDSIDETKNKAPEKITNELHRNNAGKLPNDEATNSVVKNATGAEEKTPPIGFNGGIVKKKRPAELLRDGSEQAKSKSASYVRGTFAEWKERKKQKKQSKATSTNGFSNQDNP